MKFGLLGRKLGHSYSPQIHAHLGTTPYVLFEKEPEEIGDFLRHGDFDGINVTMPYKKDVMAYCDRLSDTAKRMGAVNTLARQPDGSLLGHNTDYFGFSQMLHFAGVSPKEKKALVLGSGGASNTAVKVLEDLGAAVVVISRSGENNYGNLHLHGDAAIVVNATPVGMYPNNGVSPVDLSLFPHLEAVLDLIYNPARTQFIMDAAARGIPCCNGLIMLVAQAVESAQWFLGRDINPAVIGKIHAALRQQMENIILIGMPGCGKTTVGKLLAEKTGKEFVDADQYLESQAGVTIPEIFARGGEAAFRAMETQVLQQLGKRSGIVLATGGGCVTRPENLPLLRQNGEIFWLTRDVSQLPTQGRPLSQSGDLSEMERIRAPLYRSFANHTVSNGTSPEKAVQEILTLWEEIL